MTVIYEPILTDAWYEHASEAYNVKQIVPWCKFVLQGVPIRAKVHPPVAKDGNIFGCKIVQPDKQYSNVSAPLSDMTGGSGIFICNLRLKKISSEK